MNNALSAALYHSRRNRAKKRIGNPPFALANFNPPNGANAVLYSYDTSVLFSGGTVTSYELVGTLPTGLGLNTTNGLISGTPSVVQTLTDIRITGINADGNATTNKADIEITA